MMIMIGATRSCRAMISLLLVINVILFHHQQSSADQPPAKPVISFCSGYHHACVVFDNNKAKCAGFKDAYGSANDYGNSPSTIGDNLPYINFGTSALIEKMACGEHLTCAKLTTGDIKCVGNNASGQTGLGVSNALIGESNGYIGDTLPLVKLGTGVMVSDIASGNKHVCVVATDGKVKCFGDNSNGQLGYGDQNNRGLLSSDMGNSLAYIDLGTGVEVVSVHSSASSYHSCVILSKPIASAQKIKCWGLNTSFQLGYGDQSNRGDESGEMGDNLGLVDLGTESRVKQLGLGYYHTCALLYNDVLKCYGQGNSGQLGSGSSAAISSTGNSLPAVLIDSGKIVKLISTGAEHSCLVYDDMQTMKCIGDNGVGTLGLGDKGDRGKLPATMLPSLPVVDLGAELVNISSIHSAYYYNCVVFSNNGVKCFGKNDQGLFALGSTNDQIGDQPGEMGTNLKYSIYFSPTQSPTQSPTPPTQPTSSPTRKPSTVPSKAPTSSPSLNPTRTPTKAPTSGPTTKTPTKSTGSNVLKPNHIMAFAVTLLIAALSF